MKQFYSKPKLVILELYKQDVLTVSDGISENKDTIEGLVGGETNPWQQP